MNKSFIFGVLSNQCEVSLAGNNAKIIFKDIRYAVIGELLRLSIKSGQGTTLNSLTDDGILFIPTLATHSYSAQDKVTCKRCTLIHRIIGSGKIVTTNKWVCSKLLPTTETTTVNDTTAESEFLSLIPFMGGKGAKLHCLTLSVSLTLAGATKTFIPN